MMDRDALKVLAQSHGYSSPLLQYMLYIPQTPYLTVVLPILLCLLTTVLDRPASKV
jgi:hypothetical protein